MNSHRIVDSSSPVNTLAEGFQRLTMRSDHVYSRTEFPSQYQVSFPKALSFSPLEAHTWVPLLHSDITGENSGK